MAFDVYLKIDGIDGEVTAKDVEKQIELLSYSFGASNPATIGPGTEGGAAGRVSISSFNVMKQTDSTSTALFLKCAEGKHFKDATVTLRKATGDGGQKPFMIYKFTTVYVDSIQWSGSTGSDQPMESLSFSFAKVEIEYYKQDEKGNLKKQSNATFDVTKISK
ncbi:MAG TPA: type VI secretion system tube protein Hcp [Fimbriiglobus sp.]|nr:type VI secretion system tube protein Hcp [Fimbriiglobus sp.]